MQRSRSGVIRSTAAVLAAAAIVGAGLVGSTDDTIVVADDLNGTDAFAVVTGDTPATAGRFTIVGRDIVDPDGNLFSPIGANVAVRQGGRETGYIFNYNGTATDRAADVKAWGWNTVRANLICLPPGSPSEAEVDAGIDAFIEEYTALGIVVMVECHDVTGRDPTPTDARVTAMYPFWERLAERWKDNPYVWFNTYNEPVPGASETQVENWLALQRDALARLRAVAPTSIFVADIPGYGQGVHTFTGPNSITRLGEDQCNVLYSWHAWGALGSGGTFGDPSEYADETASRENHLEALTYLRDHDIPVMIGEFGDPLTLDQGSAGLPIWNRIAARALIDLAPQFGVGMLWWHATGDSSIWLTYSLMQDNHAAPWSAASTGEGLSDGGLRFWNASKNAPDLGPFTGDLSESNCSDTPPTSTTTTTTSSTTTSSTTTEPPETTTTTEPPTTTTSTTTTDPPTTTTTSTTTPPTTTTTTTTTLPSVCSSQIFEAETAALNGVQIDRNWTPYSGTGVIGWFDAVGDTITWNVTVPSTRSYNLSWRYATTQTAWTRSVEIDGAAVGSVGAGSTTAWNRYADTVDLPVTLTAGTHQITLAYRTANRQNINVDYLTVGCAGTPPGGTTTTTAPPTTTTSTTTTIPASTTTAPTTTAPSTTTTTTTTTAAPPTTIPTGTTSTTTTTAPPTSCSSQRYEAENAALNGVQLDRNWTPFSGTGVVGWFETVGDTITWTVTVPSTRSYDLSWRYATTQTSWTRSIEVDGAAVGSVGAGSTTAWNRYADTVGVPVTLTAGTHQVTLAYRSNNRQNINVDYLTVGCAGTTPPSTTTTTTTAPTTAPTTTTTAVSTTIPSATTTTLPTACASQRYEAETAALAGVQIDRNWTPFSGTGVVGWFETVGDTITWTVTVPTTRTYTLSWRYATTQTGWTRSVEVDGAATGSVGAGSTTAWNRYLDTATTPVTLTAGSHEIRLAYRSANRQNINVDYLTVGCATP